MRPMDTVTFWHMVAEVTLGTIDQHKYAWSMMWDRLPKSAQYYMERGDRLLINLRSDLESEMFRTGGPQDINVFYPGEKREPGKTYPPTNHRGRKYPAMNVEEWREIGEELDRCLSYSRTLTKLLSGKVRANLIDRAIKYHDAVIRARMALEPVAQEQIGCWSVLYPEEAAP